MHNDRHDNIFDDDDALDFIIYEDLKKQDRDQKRGNNGCLCIIVLMLLPVASVMFLCK
jgi:hypothetical protein